MMEKCMYRCLTYLIFICTIFSSWFTQYAIAESSGSDRNYLIGVYLKGAFSGKNQLVKPEITPNITYYCGEQFCLDLIIELKSDFPTSIGQNEVDSPELATISVVNIRFYLTNREAIDAANKLMVHTGEQVATLQFPSCVLTRFNHLNSITRAVVDIVADKNSKANIACALIETARGTGLMMSQEYPDYSLAVRDMDDHSIQRFLMGVHNLLDMHWSSSTKPGMLQDEVSTALQSIYVKKQN